jgi:hypothetical protein
VQWSGAGASCICAGKRQRVCGRQARLSNQATVVEEVPYGSNRATSGSGCT